MSCPCRSDGRLLEAASDTSGFQHRGWAFSIQTVLQVNGRLLVGTSGTSPLKPSEVALLEVGSVEELIASRPEQWQALQRSSRAQVQQSPLELPLLFCGEAHRLQAGRLAGAAVLQPRTGATEFS